MSQSVSKTYRHIVTLEDGARLLFRPFIAEDAEDLIELYASAPLEELRALHNNMTDPEAVRAWAKKLDYSQILPLLALIDNQIIGTATLYRRGGPYQHVGEVQIFLRKDFRGRGLGTTILQILIDLARKEGLHWLKAEAFVNQPKTVRAFEKLGFKQQCVLEDYFMLADGRTEDIVVLHMRLLKLTNEF